MRTWGSWTSVKEDSQRRELRSWLWGGQELARLVLCGAGLDGRAWTREQ